MNWVGWIPLYSTFLLQITRDITNIEMVNTLGVLVRNMKMVFKISALGVW